MPIRSSGENHALCFLNFRFDLCGASGDDPTIVKSQWYDPRLPELLKQQAGITYSLDIFVPFITAAGRR